MNSRRHFLKLISTSLALTAMPFVQTRAMSDARIVIVGGGVAGTRVAAYLKLSSPASSVVLIDSQLNDDSFRKYINIKSQNKPIEKSLLVEMGVKVFSQPVTMVDPVARSVRLSNGKSFQSDFLIMAPGVDFNWNEVNGQYSEEDMGNLHAWDYPNSEKIIWDQVKSISKDENIIISIPKAPYRFPDGPYERVTKIADYLQKVKSSANVFVLDNNKTFPNMSYYLKQWQSINAGESVKWLSNENGDGLEKVNLKKRTVYVAGEKIKAGVINIIPPQHAGAIAREAGLTLDNDWCNVNLNTLESSIFDGIYVLGDANNADLYNKTAATANLHASKCASYLRGVMA